MVVWSIQKTQVASLISVAVLTMAGCGSGPASRPDASDRGEDAPSQRAAWPQDGSPGDLEVKNVQAGRRTLERFKRDIRSTGTTHVIHDSSLEGDEVQNLTGDFDVNRLMWSAEVLMADPDTEERYQMRAKSIGLDSWMQMDSWDRPCWLGIQSTQVPLGITSLSTGVPAYHYLLSTLRTQGQHPILDNRLVGTISAVGAIALLPGRLAHELEAQRHRKKLLKTRVPVMISTVGDRLSVVLRGSETLEAILVVTGDPGRLARTYLANSEERVHYRRSDEPVTVTTPTDQSKCAKTA